MKWIKMTVIGDEGVGKTSLLITYTSHTFPSTNVPNTYDNYSSNILVDNKPINLSLWDTCGNTEYDDLRPLSYAETDIFLLCFSLSDPVSLENIRTKWNPEILHHAPNTPIVLVGTKVDLRDADMKHSGNKERRASLMSGRKTSTAVADTLQLIHQIQQQRKASHVEHEQGLAMAVEIDAVRYIECSSLTKKHLNVVFDEAIQTVLHPECKAHGERNCQKCDKEQKSGGCNLQ